MMTAVYHLFNHLFNPLPPEEEVEVRFLLDYFNDDLRKGNDGIVAQWWTKLSSTAALSFLLNKPLWTRNGFQENNFNDTLKADWCD